MADYTKYTNKEMQAITLAQCITNDNIAIVGTGLPLIGASVAKRLFAPKCNLIVESGLMDCSPIEVPRSVGDLRSQKTSRGILPVNTEHIFQTDSKK